MTVMGKILCATRGGEASRRAQEKAIALAKERGDELVFLYVVDIHFLDKTAAPIVVDVGNEVTKMGEFLLLMAQERATQEGVAATTIVRKGKVREELKRAAHEGGVTLVVLGRPVGDDSVFHLTSLQNYAADLEAETGVETRII
jgi:nucleotide-binding universal stress UspA family protein